ncbi:MAG: formyltransferase family protein, partial [Rubrivivax sp.]|nr:formyltransferase family protein [Rubrivivax sp.]
DLERADVDVAHQVVGSKAELLSVLAETAYDTLISNGCPYILPIAKMPVARYVNIHPSCLPDLRGVDPVIGAVLQARDSGATCHIMDSGIDTGPIIAQVRIPYTDDLDVTSLYQLSFVAEQRAFDLALKRDFVPLLTQTAGPNDIYFSRTAADQIITFEEPNDLLLRKIKAFNNRSQGCEFKINERLYRVYAASRMHNPFLLEYTAAYNEGLVVFSYENSIIFRKDGEVLRFMDIVSTDGGPVSVGDRLF